MKLKNDIAELKLQSLNRSQLSRGKSRFLNMCPNFGKLAKLSHLVFQEIPVTNIETTVVFLCQIVAMPDIQYTWNSLLASVS